MRLPNAMSECECGTAMVRLVHYNICISIQSSTFSLFMRILYKYVLFEYILYYSRLADWQVWLVVKAKPTVHINPLFPNTNIISLCTCTTCDCNSFALGVLTRTRINSKLINRLYNRLVSIFLKRENKKKMLNLHLISRYNMQYIITC